MQPAMWRLDDVAKSLAEAHALLANSGAQVPADDLAAVLLASAVRPFVLIAGPPGAGKSSIVRVIARLIGADPPKTFHEIAVQAHWENDEALFGNGGLLKSLLGTSAHHVVLFDEFNLTRPEYYLSQMFASVDRGAGWIDGQEFARCAVFGTLNIDDTSRPPSPKVIDRCFLLELDAPKGDQPARWPKELPPLPKIGVPPTIIDLQPSEETAALVQGVVEALHTVVNKHHLRQDLLPSRRALADIQAFLGLHERLGLDTMLSPDDAIDRCLLGRILVRMSGPVEQVGPVLTVLRERIPLRFRRCSARLELAKHQEKLGFVSPWQ